MSSRYRRHSLIRLSERGWCGAAAAAVSEQHRLAILRWQEQDWPGVIRRSDGNCPADHVCLGIALPPDQHGVKLRVPLRAALSDVRDVCEPLALSEVIPHAPSQWQVFLRHLDDDMQAQGLSVRVYGSLALQALTGQRYLRDASDIDVLFSPSDAGTLEQGMRLLKMHAHRLPLDGEVAFPGGVAVSWKEWLQMQSDQDNRVLAKRSADVALLRVRDLLALFDKPDEAHEAHDADKAKVNACAV